MRKHDVRKWLHAILDLLPVIIIPVFMIYSHRHTIDSYSITVPKYDEIVMQQNIINGKPVLHNGVVDTWSFSLAISDLHIDNDGYLSFENPYYEDVNCVVLTTDFDVVSNDKLYLTFNLESTGFDLYFYLNDGDIVIDEDTGIFDIGYNVIPFTIDSDLHISNFEFDISGLDGGFGIKDIQIFNFTQMFGVGNEPSINEFITLFPQQYYDVNSHISVVIQNGTNTYNDTDIGSQMFYCLYNSVDKYFNMGDVFNLNGVYEWFNANIFHGNIPSSIYVVWNIVLYEFVMDLLFLLYGLFMWFIDMVEKIMDKPFKSIK